MSWIILKKHGPERKFPLTDTLIDIAIAEKRPDDVIRWYDKRKPKEIGWWERGFQDNKVAEAVVGRYSDRALGIWKKLAEAESLRGRRRLPA